MALSLIDPSTLTNSDIDVIACQFLRSAYADKTYIDWTLDRRLEGFLRRGGFDRLAEDGDAYDLLLDRVMAHIGQARRTRFGELCDRLMAPRTGTSVPVGDGG